MLFFGLFSLQSAAQVTNLYSQNFGTGTGFPTGWSAGGSSTWTISTSNSSTPTPTFSGGSNLASGSSSNSRTVSFSNSLSTIGYTGITVLWAGRRNSSSSLTFEWSADGTNWNTLAVTNVPNNSTWAWVNGGTGARISLPAGAAGASNLSFRWTFDSNGSGGAYRIDDFTVEGCKLPDPPGSVSGSATPCSGTSQNYSVVNVSGVSYTWTFPADWVQTAGGSTNSVTVTVGSSSGTVSVTPSNSCGTGTASTLSVHVEAIPNQPGVITGEVSPCAGSSQSYSVPNVSGVTYTWSFPAGWVQTGGGNTSIITVTVGASSGNIQVIPSNSCGSGTSRTMAVSPTLGVPSQPGTITGNTTPCLGTTESYSVPNVAGTTYSWSVPAGWTINSGQGSSSINVTVGAGSGNVTVTPSNACGNGTARSLAVSTLTIPSQPSTITGNSTCCIGATETFSVVDVPGITYTWTIPAGWSINSGQGTHSIDVTVGASSGTLEVEPSNACGTGPSRTMAVTVIDIPLQPSSISGNSFACKLSTQVYSVLSVAGVTYTWTLPSGWTFVSGQGTHSITVTVGTLSGNVSVIPSNTCGNGPGQSLSVTVQLSAPAQPGAIAGTTAPCSGSSTGYSVTNVAGVTYNWSVPSGWIITGGQGSNAITVTVGITAGNITVSPFNTCGGGAPRTLAVTPLSSAPVQPSQITGDTTICATGTQVYSVINTVNVYYTWTVPVGWLITTGQGTNSITVVSGSVSGTISVEPSNSCGVGPSRSIEVEVDTASPAASSAIVGNNNTCEGSSQTYSVVNTPGVTYTWSLPSDWTLTSGQGTSTIHVIVGSLSGNIVVLPGNACGDGPSTVLAIIVDPLPPATGDIFGKTSVCEGSVQTYSVTDVPGITYTWTLPSGWTLNSGQGTYSIEVTIGTLSGQVQVVPSNSCGNGPIQEKTIEVNLLPSAYTGPSVTICEGASYQLGGPAVPGNSYSWTSDPPGFTSTFSNPVVTPSTTTSYTLVEENPATGCIHSNTIVITLNQVITVTVDPSSLTQEICSGDTTEIVLTSNLAGTVFTWTATLTSGSGTTFNASGTGSPIREIITNTSSLPSKVTYSILATASPCTNSSTTFTVTINPIPEVYDQSGTVCSDQPAGLTLGSSVNGVGVVSYSISNINSNGLTASAGNPVTGTGFTASEIADDAWTNITTGSVDVVYTVLPYSDLSCPGDPFQVTLTIHPRPVLTNPLEYTICSGTATSIALSSSIPGTFSWTTGNITGGISGASAGSGSSISQVLTNPSYVVAGKVEYIVVPLSAGGGCQGIPDTITVTVLPSPQVTNPPAYAICSGLPFVAALTASIPAEFSWTVGTVTGGISGASAGSGDTILQVLVNPSTTGVGSVEYVITPVSLIGDCTGSPFTITVTVNPIHAVTAGASETAVCPAISFNLFSTSTISGTPLILSEGFNAPTNNWSTTNSSTGGTPANAAWTLRPDGYITSSTTFHSNDASQFYMSNSRAQDGTITATTLVSPEVSSVGYSDLSLSFWHYFNFNSTSGEYARVEISTNGGSSWSTVATYTSDIGGASSFQNESINLGSTYINSANLRIRFNYYCGSNRGRYWAIDNVSLTGTPVSTPVIAWTSNPAGFISSQANPSNVSQVVSTTYTVTYTNPSTGCSNQDSVTVAAHPVPDASITADYCSVPGKIRLTGHGGGTYLWNTGETTQYIDVDIVGIYSVVVTNGFGCSETAFISVANELVIDGSFTNFNPSSPSFVTLYTQNQPYYSGIASSGLYPEGYYAVNTSAWSNYPNAPDGYHPNFHGRDHTNNTTGTRNFLMVNGSINPNQTIWQQTVAVQPHTDYYFSAWGMNLNPASPAELQFEINGVPVGTIADLDVAPKPTNESQVDITNWVRFYSNPYWNSGSATSAVIKIINLNTLAGGNDFGLDDISFGTLAQIPFTIDPYVDGDGIFCEGEDVQLHTNISGGKPVIHYHWTGPNGFTSTQQDPLITNIGTSGSGRYYLTVTDGYGCDPVLDSVDIVVHPLPEAGITGPSSACLFSPSPSITLTGTSGQEPYTFVYNLNGGVNDTITTISGNSVMISVPTSTPGSFTYTIVSVTSSTGCTSSPVVSHTITIHMLPTCIITGSSIVCPASENNLYSGIPGMSSYSWSISGNGAIVGGSGGESVTVNAGDTCNGYFTLELITTDTNGCTAICEEYITVEDNSAPLLSCPDDLISPADPGLNYATLTVLSPFYSDDCNSGSGLEVSWLMSTPTASSGTGLIPSPYQFNIGTTTVTYTIEDPCGNIASCSFTVTVTENEDVDIECPPDTTINTDADQCTATFDPGQPLLLSGQSPVSWQWIMSGATSGSGTGNTVLPNPCTFNNGTTLITWICSNADDSDTCVQTVTVIDAQPPQILPPGPFSFCVESIQTAVYYDPTMDIQPDRPEYYLFTAGSLTFDLDTDSITDNCPLTCSPEIRWRIDFSDGSSLPATPGTYYTGQPSTYGSDIQFPGAISTDVIHMITYQVVDCSNNVSIPQPVSITVTPRPNVIKQ